MDEHTHDHDDDGARVTEVRERRFADTRIRGGVALGAIVTGVAVAFGTMFLLTALLGGIAVGVGLLEETPSVDAVDIGLGVGIALVVAQLLSYLWGGYTAGRMARGAGALNGFLVPLVAILLVALTAGLVAAFGDTAADAANVNLPFQRVRLYGNADGLAELGVGLGIASLVVMFLGGILGGLLGARWHDKLEAREVDAARDDEVRTTRAA